MNKWTWVVLVVAVAVLGLIYSVMQQRRALDTDVSGDIGVEEYESGSADTQASDAESDAPLDETEEVPLEVEPAPPLED